jgi:hypothetical protein
MGRKTCNGLRVGILLTLLVCALAGCGKKEAAEELPQEYAFGEETVAAPELEEGAAVSQEEVDGGTVYTYSGLSSPGQTSADYAALLTGADAPFSVVDDDCVQTDAPDYTQEEGSVCLARDAAQDGTVCFLKLEWDLDTCTVTAVTREGEVAAAGEGRLTMLGALDYLSSFDPADLGLEGSSMDEYRLYALDGAVFVDGMPCLRVKVCSADSARQFNQIVGNYLITGDKRHLYSLDEITGAVEELHV